MSPARLIEIPVVFHRTRSGFGVTADEGDAGLGKKNPHWGTTLDEFLTKEGIREAAKAEALTRVVAWQLS